MSLTSLVLDEVAAGTSTVAAIASSGGVDRGLVELAVERLVAAGRLDAQALSAGCPAQGCGGCPSRKSGCRAQPGGSGAWVLTIGRLRP